MLSAIQHLGPLPTGCGFVVAIPDIDLLLRQDTAAWLRKLLLEHGLLVIRAVPLTPVQQIAFSQGFGVVEVLPWQPSQLPEWPEIFRVSNHPEHGLTEVGRSWHSDGMYLPCPREISIFHIVSIPTEGGETEFASLHAAFDAAPSDLLQRLHGKQSLFAPGVTHPIIRPHPITGRLGFYVKLGKSRNILSLDSSKSEDLFSRIQELLESAGRVYCHQWQTGDIIVVDNFSFAHRAKTVPPHTLRVLHRTTIVGGGRIIEQL